MDQKFMNRFECWLRIGNNNHPQNGLYNLAI